MISEKTINTLELNKILNRLADYTSFSAGADLARELRPSVDMEEVKTWQRETQEARLLFENKHNVSMGGARDVRDASILAQRGVMIEPHVLLDIRTTLRRAGTLKKTLMRAMSQRWIWQKPFVKCSADQIVLVLGIHLMNSFLMLSIFQIPIAAYKLFKNWIAINFMVGLNLYSICWNDWVKQTTVS